MKKEFSGIMTSEMVSPGHPDKIADYIADCIVDAATRGNKYAHCAIEVMLQDDLCILGGQVKGVDINFPYMEIVKKAIKKCEYNYKALDGYSARNLKLLNFINQQSQEIDKAVEGLGGEMILAGDQGIIFGYATNETPELIPMAVKFNKTFMKKMWRDLIGSQYGIRPDMKCQVSVKYEEGKPHHPEMFLASISHRPDVDLTAIEEVVKRNAEEAAFDVGFKLPPQEYLINPSGSFTICGPVGDTGITGRKLISDTYQGYCPHGGGAMSGKDLSKVDRSAALYSRWIANHVIASGLADEVIIQFSFAIGRGEPLSMMIDCRGRNNYPTGIIEGAIKKSFSLDTHSFFEKFSGVEMADLGQFGWFGEDPRIAPWERLDLEIVLDMKKFADKAFENMARRQQ